MTLNVRRRTLRDVAVEAGVSEMTVSRVLREKPEVSARTRRHVLEVVDRLGYVPNRLAGSLATARSNQVAVILPSLQNYVFSRVMSGISVGLESAGYYGLLGVTDYSLSKEENLVLSMMSWRPAGVIIANLVHSERTRNILGNANVPVVEVMDTSAPPIDMCVGFDHEGAGFAIVDHLYARGYRHCGYLGWNTSGFAASRRYLAIRRRLDEAGLSLVAPEIFSKPPDFMAGKEGLAALLRKHPVLDAVIFSNDIAAAGGVMHCMETGIRLPDHLAIVGFSGLQIGQVLPRKLTTIRTRRLSIGRLAARKLLNALAGQRLEPVLDLGFELVVGDTT